MATRGSSDLILMELYFGGTKPVFNLKEKRRNSSNIDFKGIVRRMIEFPIDGQGDQSPACSSSVAFGLK